MQQTMFERVIWRIILLVREVEEPLQALYLSYNATFNANHAFLKTIAERQPLPNMLPHPIEGAPHCVAQLLELHSPNLSRVKDELLEQKVSSFAWHEGGY